MVTKHLAEFTQRIYFDGQPRNTVRCDVENVVTECFVSWR